MRTIKFRAKTLDFKVYGLIEFELSDIGKWDLSCDVFYAKGVPCDSNSIHQFTGLKDKNGKEIYQSDQLKAKSNQTKKNIEGVVEWRNDEAAFRLVVENDYMYKLHDIHNVEVIGNIYEGLHSGEKLDILDKWRNNTEKQSQNPSKDIELVKKLDEKSG